MPNKKTNKIILATDLDRTLMPNGKNRYDNSLEIFRKLVSDKKTILIYVTGRNLKLVEEAIKEYSLPRPDYIIGNVGTRIYGRNKKEIKNWEREIKKQAPLWNLEKFRSLLKNIPGLELQEKSKQDKFKLSYYVHLKKEKQVLKKVEKLLPKKEKLQVVYSRDFPHPRGLLDILPKGATKKGALNYLTKKLKLKKEQIVFAGDSGNDLPLFISKYKSIVVNNASRKIKKIVKKNKNKKDLYIAKKGQYIKKLNGNYVSGIIQGLIHFNIIEKEDILSKYRK